MRHATGSSPLRTMRLHWESVTGGKLRNFEYLALLILGTTQAPVHLAELGRPDQSRRTTQRHRRRLQSLVAAGLLTPVGPDAWTRGKNFGTKLS